MPYLSRGGGSAISSSHKFTVLLGTDGKDEGGLLEKDMNEKKERKKAVSTTYNSRTIS